MSDLREKLARMTVENGASLNEERIAQEKMAKYTKFMNKPARPKSFLEQAEEAVPPEERRFLREWFQLKMANRRKWNAG